MFKRVITFLGGLAVAGCNQSSTLSPLAFTDFYAAEMRKTAPELNITVAAPLHLKVKKGDGNETQSFLDNAYNTYRMSPADRDAIVTKYITAFKESLSDSEEPIDKTRIVPVIKDKNYLTEIRQSVAERGTNELAFMNLYEIYNSELWIFYAVDSPKSMRFLSREDIAKLDIATNSLRKLAFDNLRKLIPKVEVRGGDGIYIVTAGGDYEASLILSDKMWTNGQFKVNGDIVVAVPSRDLLIVTGSSDNAGLAKARKLVAETMAQAPYRLTSELFIYRDGKFEVFRE